MNSSTDTTGFNVIEVNGEKNIVYKPASFSSWIHIPVLLTIYSIQFLSVFFSIFLLFFWALFTYKSRQENHIFIEKNKLLVGNDSVKLDQITAFVLTNILSDNKIIINLSDVIRTDEIVNKFEIDEFLKKEKFKKAFQINMKIGNTEKKLAYNLSPVQAKNLLYYFSQGQYLISSDKK